MKNNANTLLVTLKPKNNASCNAISNTNLSKTNKQFLTDMTNFCKIQQRPFCLGDSNLTSGNFRQKIHLLKDYIVPVIKGRPTFYGIKGMQFPLEPKFVTLNPMGLSRIQSILEDCRDQPPMIHDIRFKIESDVYEKLLKKGLTPNKNNHSITLNNIPTLDSALNFKILA